jgi:hypothetical protein
LLYFYKPHPLPSSKRVVENEGGPVDERLQCGPHGYRRQEEKGTQSPDGIKVS